MFTDKRQNSLNPYTNYNVEIFSLSISLNYKFIPQQQQLASRVVDSDSERVTFARASAEPTVVNVIHIFLFAFYLNILYNIRIRTVE